MKLEKCFVPAPTYCEGLEAYEVHAHSARLIARNHLEAHPVRIDHQPVYLSRTRLIDPNARRGIVNEPALESALASRGFRIVHPETLTLTDQIELFNAHTFVAGCWGSAFHGILFSLRADALTTNESHYLSVMRKIPPREPNQTRRDVVIDIEAALSHFEAVGVI